MQHIVHNRQWQAEETSDNALLLRGSSFGRSFVELEKFLRCFSKTEKQIMSERCWNFFNEDASC